MNLKVMSMRSKNRFTLIELLVVLSVIGMLLCLLLPALNQIKSELQTIQCSENMSEISLSLSDYAADNIGYLPAPSPSTNAGSWEFRRNMWIVKISHYTPTPFADIYAQTLEGSIFYCPKEGLRSQLANYGINWKVSKKSGENISWSIHPKRAISLFAVKDPSSLFIISDSSNWISDSSPMNQAFPHDEKTNVLFLDGHVSENDQLEYLDLPTSPQQ